LLNNSKDQYGWVSIIIHWIMALAIFGMFGLGLYMVDLTYLHEYYKLAPDIHRSVGVLLLFLLAIRLGWRLMNPVPDIFGQSWEKVIARWVHRGHYLFMFALMISGYLISTADGRAVDVFNWFEMPAFFPAEKGREEMAGFIHMLLAWGFMGYVGMHAAAALKHHFVDHDITLLRMFGIIQKEKGEEE